MALQIVTEKPQPPAWKSIGFDEQLAATVYQHALTGETVGWSLPPAKDQRGAVNHGGRPKSSRSGKPSQNTPTRIRAGSLVDYVLEAVCNGAERVIDINRRSGSTKANAHLQILIDLGCVTRATPNSPARPLYRPTSKGIDEHKRLMKARIQGEIYLTQKQEIVLKAIVAGIDAPNKIVARYKISRSSIHFILEALLKRKLITKTIIHRTLSQYTATDAGWALAKALR